MTKRRSELLALFAVGAVAGLAASAATSTFQAAWSRAKVPPQDLGTDEPPPTEVLADRLAELVRGTPLATGAKALAGEAIHYAMGALLGVAYVLGSRRWPTVSAAGGLAYGAGVWILVEEGGLWFAQLKPAPWRVRVAEHIFAASSHLVFGATLHAVMQVFIIHPGQPAGAREVHQSRSTP